VAHRDLKLENLLLAAPGDISAIKIADFGLAKKATRADGVLDTICGTPQYVAPEVIAVRHHHNPTSVPLPVAFQPDLSPSPKLNNKTKHSAQIALLDALRYARGHCGALLGALFTALHVTNGSRHLRLMARDCTARRFGCSSSVRQTFAGGHVPCGARPGFLSPAGLLVRHL